jgi:hypothetical protein
VVSVAAWLGPCGDEYDQKDRGIRVTYIIEMVGLYGFKSEAFLLGANMMSNHLKDLKPPD